MNEVIFITDEHSWDAVIRSGTEELTEEEARAALTAEGVEFEDRELRRQAFLEGDASRSEYDRVFYPVDEAGHQSAYIGWVLE